MRRESFSSSAAAVIGRSDDIVAHNPAALTEGVVRGDRVGIVIFSGASFIQCPLTFDYSAAPHVCADLLLCADVVAQEAADQGKPLEDHYAHLLVHGALHAQGLDHETSDADADAMEAQEARILAKLGFANPYA